MSTQQLLCNFQIDYSDVQTDPILPFRIELDLVNSILLPMPGQNQKFCYRVTGIGADTSAFADLSHLVLSICDEIPKEQIVNISVTVDGQVQQILFQPGGNVELFIPPNTDPPTGCPGLKFDFEVAKDGGVMLFCFELTTTYPVGPNPVCLFGGNTTASGLSICGPVCREIQTCDAIGYQPANVCVPVRVTPFAVPGRPITTCHGDPVISPGTQVCPGIVNGSCYFTITQQICVAVPVHFGANSMVGAPSVQCLDATSGNCVFE